VDELTRQDELYAKLANFTGSEEFYRHPLQAFVYTEGVRFLADHARLYWLLDVIASHQPHAMKDPWLREFQLWELRISGHEGVAVCLRDTDDEAFRQRIEFADSALDYVRLYLEGGVLLLPSEH
jgi:hypothetical protein